MWAHVPNAVNARIQPQGSFWGSKVIHRVVFENFPALLTFSYLYRDARTNQPVPTSGPSKPAKYETSGNHYVIQSWAARLAYQLIGRDSLFLGPVDKFLGKVWKLWGKPGDRNSTIQSATQIWIPGLRFLCERIRFVERATMYTVQINIQSLF
jgi:hypothetical protein